MARQLARNLYQLVRGAARRTSVEGLKQDGRKTVSVISFRQVEELIEKAVHNTLRRRGLHLDQPEIEEEVRLGVLALVAERDDLQLTVHALMREKQELERNTQRLNQELSRAQAAYRSEEQAWSGPGDPDDVSASFDALRDELAAGLTELLQQSEVGEGLDERVVGLVSTVVDEQRGAMRARAREGHETRLSHFRRRIDKLKRKLGEAEEMLARARSAEGPEAIVGEPVDPGLDQDDPNYKAKSGLLGDIFRLNVELRDTLGKG